MKFVILMIILYVFGFAEDFITPNEYAKMLYKNPRGIGCNTCHGEKGEGKLIAKYKHKGVEKQLFAPSINNLGEKKFTKALKDSKGVMPSYFLTDYEIKSLYTYVIQFQKKEKNEKSKKQKSVQRSK